jgi:flagellar biosynthesis protein FlhF
MRLKLYRAAAIAEAIAQVRAELGADALLLSSRRVAGGVEVTAALEKDEAPASPLPSPPVSADPRRAAAFAWHGVPAGLARRLQAGPLPFALSAALGFEKLALDRSAPPLLVVGPPGAGKTLTVARLAARLVMAGIAPVVVTTDGKRAGAAEQLAAFTRLLDLQLLVASTPAALARALARREGGAPVLIDSPGSDPFDAAQRDEIAALAATASADLAVVLPAGLDAGEAADLAGAYAACGARLLAATRLDLARRIGGVLAAAGAGLALAEAGIGPGAADGLVPMTPDLLATRLMCVPEFSAARTGARLT